MNFLLEYTLNFKNITYYYLVISCYNFTATSWLLVVFDDVYIDMTHITGARFLHSLAITVRGSFHKCHIRHVVKFD